MIVTRKNRETGTMISVGRTQAEFGVCMDEPDSWATMCEDHGNFVTHATRKMAEWHAPNPTGWCEGCRDLVFPEHEELHREEAYSSGGVKRT